jgi:hypothetical protein
LRTEFVGSAIAWSGQTIRHAIAALEDAKIVQIHIAVNVGRRAILIGL